VKKGDLLAVIQPDQWAADMAFYEQSQKGAATQVSMAEAQLRFQEAQTKSQIAQAEANVAAAAAMVEQAQADLENARLTFEHESEAYKLGGETIQGYDQARTAYDAQKARLQNLQMQRDSASAAVNVAKANLEQVAARGIEIDMDKHQLEAAAAQKDKARVQLDYTNIVAPVNGIVDVRAALQGEVVNPTQPIVTLIDEDNLWVRVDIEETYIDGIHLGDQLMVRLPSGKEMPGKVFYRAVDADYATQRDVSRTKRDIKTFEVRLRVDNSKRDLAVGMTASVILPAEKILTEQQAATRAATSTTTTTTKESVP
jgi:multidrug resistance efflux pump